MKTFLKYKSFYLTAIFLGILGFSFPSAFAEELTKNQIKSSVTRALFTSGIKNKEPLDEIKTLTNDKKSIYFFTDLKNFAGHPIRHQWFFNNVLQTEVSFSVRSNRWRMKSKKNLPTKKTGVWRVDVVNWYDEVLASKTFLYEEQ